MLSVNAAFAAGVLDIGIQDDGNNTDASLLSDNGTDFFVDADGDQVYDATELRGLISDLTKVNVTGDAGVGTFFWRDNFSAAALLGPGTNVVQIADVQSAELAATADITGNVSLSAEQSLQLGGDLSIDGTLTATVSAANGQISGAAGAALDVTGAAALTAHSISIGNAAGDHFTVGSLTFNSDGAVQIFEDGTVSDPDTLIIGSCTADSVEITSQGTIQVDGEISTLTGDIDLHAADQIGLSGTTKLTAHSVGEISLNADGSGIAMADGSQVTAAGNMLINADNGNISTSTLWSQDGEVRILARDGDVTIGNVTAGTNIVVIARQGSLNDQQDDALVDFTAVGEIVLISRDEIAGPGLDQFMEFADGTTLTATSVGGPMLIRGLGAITLSSMGTGDRGIVVEAAGTVNAINVSSSTLDAAANSIRITTSVGDVVVGRVQAGAFQGEILISAQGSILDGDTFTDDVDVEGNDITLIAQTGNIGSIGPSIFKGSINGLEVVTHGSVDFPADPGNLTATALLGTIVIDASVTGTATYNTNSLFLVSTGDLDVSSTTFAVANLGLLADSDFDGNGTLTLGQSLSVTGDLRVQGAAVVSTGPNVPVIELGANRLLFVSLGQANILAHAAFVDATTTGHLSITSTLPAVELVDLNCDNVALQTLGSSGSIQFISHGTVTVSDDVIAGNDGTTTSTGDINIGFGVGAAGDILVHDSVLSDHGNISLIAPGSVVIEHPVVADPHDEDGADNLANITTVSGNVLIQADSDGNGGQIRMADGAKVVAGRDTASDYVAGIDGLASPSAVGLGSPSQVAGHAEIVLAATDSITLGSLQSANATANAIQVTSSQGGIVDGGDSDVDLVADNAGAKVLLTAHAGIGSNNVLETAIDSLDAQNANSGNIGIREVAVGGNLHTVAIHNLADTGSVLVAVDAGNLNIAGSGVSANNGPIDLLANQDLSVLSPISATGAGSVYLHAGHAISVQAVISSENGDVLLDAIHDMHTAAAITSGDGAVGLVAAGNIHQSSMVSTAGDMLIRAGGSLLMSSSAENSAANMIIAVTSTASLGLLTGDQVAIECDGHVLDANGASLNVVSSGLKITSRLGEIGQADASNGMPSVNVNAIDIQVETVATSATGGTYLQQLSGNLTVGSLAAFAVDVTVQTIAFDSSSNPVTQSQISQEKQGLATQAGPIKVVVDEGSLLVDSAVMAGGAGDVLLRAANDVNINATVSSGTGHITLFAGDDLNVNAAVQTTGDRSIYLAALNAIDGDTIAPAVDGINISGPVSGVNGSILIDSASSVRVASGITSTTASIGIQSAHFIVQAADLSAGENVWMLAGNNITQAGGSTSAGETVQLESLANIALGSIQARHVSLEAGQDILDNNGASIVNVQAATLRLLSGGIIGGPDTANSSDTNDYAIDLQVGTVAASSVTGIYLQQLSGDLIVANVAGSASVAASQVNFNSTTSSVALGNSADIRVLDDLATTSGPIKVVLRNGSLSINDGIDADGVGVSAGSDILLAATGDLLVNAAVNSVGGHITLSAGQNLDLNAAVTTSGLGTLYLRGLSISVDGPLSADSSLLLEALQNIQISSTLTSHSASIGLYAGNDVLQSADITAGLDFLIEAGRDFTQTSATATASEIAYVTAGGSIRLDLLDAKFVSLESGGDILDNNGEDVLNIRASQLSMLAVAGGGIIGGSDLSNSPRANGNAIDVEVDTVSALSDAGIYLQELASGGNLTIGHVSIAGSLATVSQVNFNSTTSPVSRGGTNSNVGLDDLQTVDGPIKVVVRGGDLLLTDGLDGDNQAVAAGGTGEVLIAATGQVIVDAEVSSDSGHVTLQAGATLDLNSAITTHNSGSIYLTGHDVSVDALVANAKGDILIDAVQDVSNTAAISSSGSIGVLAGRDFSQQADILAGRDVLIAVGGDYTQTASSLSAVATTQITAGGTIHLDLITGQHVSLEAGGDILDNNGANVVNVRATTLRMLAGGIIGGPDVTNSPNANDYAIDIQVGTVAAQSIDGIYLQQLSGDLFVDHVAGAASISVQQVNFNSSTSTLALGDINSGSSGSSQPQDDLEATNGPVKVVVRDGSLTINAGDDNDNSGVFAGGDILLSASIDVTTHAAVSSGGGHITLQATKQLTVNSDVTTSGSGTIYLAGDTISVAGSLATADGDIVLESVQGQQITSTITATAASVGLVAGTDIMQSANITAGRDFLVEAGDDFTQTGARAAAENTAYVSTGGTIRLDFIDARFVALEAGGDILDNNGGDTLNIRSQELLLEAGGFIGGADLLNSLELNANAIDLQVDTIAALSSSGNYLQQIAGSLTVSHVSIDTSRAVLASQVNFNSTTSIISRGGSEPSEQLDDLVTSDGPIKVVVRDGDLFITDGLDNDMQGVTAGAAGDILLAASGQILVNAEVSSGSGHLTLRAGTLLDISSSIATHGSGSIYLTGNDVSVDAPVANADGDILIDAVQDVSNTTTIASNAGIGIVAGRDFLQSADLVAGRDVVVSTGGDHTSTASTTAGQTVQISSAGTIWLEQIFAQHVSLEAGQDILDNNAGNELNIQAATLRMIAGGIIGGSDLANTPHANFNAIDVQVGTIAARSVNGIYLQQLSGDLIVDHVTGSAAVGVQQVNFNSTIIPVAFGDANEVRTLDDLEATNGPVKLVVRNNNLTINDGADGDGKGVSASGDILLAAAANLSTNATITSKSGHITLQATQNLEINAVVSTSGLGTIYFNGNMISIDGPVSADQNILIEAVQDLQIAATLTSTNAIVGLIAGGDFDQTANVYAGRDILVAVGGNVTQTGAHATAIETVHVSADGSIRLDVIEARDVSLRAGQDILDNNGENNLNVRSAQLLMVAAGNGGGSGIIGGSDLPNSPSANSNAIDLDVGTVAAFSNSGIYMQELVSGGDLNVGHVSIDTSRAALVSQVNFNSTTDSVSRNSANPVEQLSDLETKNGPIKVYVRGGDLNVNDGLDGDGQGVTAGGTGDVLLAASGQINVDADVSSQTGHVTLHAGTTLNIGSAIETYDAGSIYLTGNDVSINASVSTFDGDILIAAVQDILNTASISGNGSIGVVAGRDISQQADITAGRDILMQAGGDFTQTGGQATATATATFHASVAGSIRLDIIDAQDISLQAGRDILDNNGASVLNLRTSQLLMLASGTGMIGGSDFSNSPDANGNAIDLQVDTLAARSNSGIYLQELASGGNLTVDHVTIDTSRAVVISQVNFNSSTNLINHNAATSTQQLDDLETTNGPIKVAVRNGDLTINDGTDGDQIGVSAGGEHDVLLSASDMVVANAQILSDSGHVTLQAGSTLDINATVSTQGTGSVLLTAADILIDGTIGAIDGSILITATQDIFASAAIHSSGQNVGMIAGRSIHAAADVTAGQNVFVAAGLNFVQVAGTVSANQTVQAAAGGSVELDLITAQHVSLEAGQDILDNNGADKLNIRASSLRMLAGGIIGGSDLAGGLDSNANAIDLEVGTVAASSAHGIYLQELVTGGDLVVGHVQGSAFTSVQQVRFNSSTTMVNVGDLNGTDLRPLDDLVTTAGPVKVVVRGGDLLINDGTDGDGAGVLAGGTGDILLSASNVLITRAQITADTGHITLQAGTAIDINSAVSTRGAGSIYLASPNISIDASVTSVAGDILMRAGQNILTSAPIQSGSGSVGLTAGQDVATGANVAAGKDLWIDAGRNFTQALNTASAGETVQIASGGTIRLSTIIASHVALDAGQDILDYNQDNTVNIRASTLRAFAGGSIGRADLLNTADANDNAIDLEVGTVAARGNTGIYLQELAVGGNLVVAHVEGSASVAVKQVRFNSSISDVKVGDTLNSETRPLDDLQTTNGPIKVVVRAGALTVNDGTDGDGRGVTAGVAGDILLAASADVTTTATVTSGSGNITLRAGDDLHIGAEVSTTGLGGIVLLAGNALAGDTPAADLDGINIHGMLHAASGNLLVDSQANVRVAAAVTADTSSIGIFAARNIQQEANITAANDVMLQANGGELRQFSGTTQAGQSVIASATGDIQLGLIKANVVSLTSGHNILDNNGADNLNIQASRLHLFAVASSQAGGGFIGGSDLANSAAANANAIDLAVDAVTAQAGAGIYLQQLVVGGNLTIDHVAGNAAFALQQVNFNSSTSQLSRVDSFQGEDLRSDSGPIKVVVREGNLTINAGTSGDRLGVAAGADGDILLSANGDVEINADVTSGSGHINVRATHDIDQIAAVSTGKEGTVLYTAGNDLRLAGTLDTLAGDMLFQAGGNGLNAANITSQAGDIAVITGGNLEHTARIQTGTSARSSIFLEAGMNIDFGSGSMAASENILLRSGTSGVAGSQTLGLLQADNVSLEARADILDGNGDQLNVRASNLQMFAGTSGNQAATSFSPGSIGLPGDPLDLQIANLAARSTDGIYLRQLADGPDVTITHVDATTARVDVQQVNFNSTLSDTTRTSSIAALDDLETQSPREAAKPAIVLEVVSGNLYVHDGTDGDGRGVLVKQTGNIVLKTTDAGSIGIKTGIETRGTLSAGNVTLAAFDWIDELQRDATGATSDATVIGESLTILAGQHAHLHNVVVNTLTATVESNASLVGDWQQPNPRANDKGDDFLDDLGADRQAAAESAGVIVAHDPNTTDTRLSAVRESYAEVARQFRFDDTYLGNYALFVQNSQSLNVTEVTAGGRHTASSPTVYIETLGAESDLTISKFVKTFSESPTEGGIVLVAGGQLSMNGLLATEAKLSETVIRTQHIQTIGSVATTDATGQAAVGYLNAKAFNGGDGVTDKDPLLTSTQFVIRDQKVGLSAAAEDYRSHVFQRVVMQYGFAGESGFVTFVGYADGEIQQFDVNGESGARTKLLDETNNDDQLALQAVLNGSGEATGFSRAIAFNSSFLDSNQMLPTTAIARRAADFFLFENASATNADEIRDLNVETFDVENVFALGAQGATELPADAPPVQPPQIVIPDRPILLSNPAQLISAEVELPVMQERTMEVAIYRVFYKDSNENGQAEESELPNAEAILGAEIIEAEQDGDVAQDSGELEQNKRLKLEKVKTETGGSPTAEDIEAKKNDFLNDPKRASGAYAIIERGLDDKEVVLDVFSVRDVEEDRGESDGPLIRQPTEGEAGEQAGSRDASPEEAMPLLETNKDSASWMPRDSHQDDHEFATARAESRFAHAGLIASSLWFASVRSQGQTKSLLASLSHDDESPTVDLSRRARRNRRWQRRTS